MKVENIINELRKMGSSKNVEGMARYGINPNNNLGVSIYKLRPIAKENGKEVCYDDTDSIFITMGSESVEDGFKLENELNLHIKKFCFEKWGIPPEKNLLELNFEKLFRSLLVDTKKRYSGWTIYTEDF